MCPKEYPPNKSNFGTCWAVAVIVVITKNAIKTHDLGIGPLSFVSALGIKTGGRTKTVSPYPAWERHSTNDLALILRPLNGFDPKLL